MPLQIGAFKIVSEGGIASGIRRIEAVAGLSAVEYLNSIDAVVRSLAGSLKARPEELLKRVAGLQDELKGANKEVEQLRAALAVAKAQVGTGHGRYMGLTNCTCIVGHPAVCAYIA